MWSFSGPTQGTGPLKLPLTVAPVAHLHSGPRIQGPPAPLQVRLGEQPLAHRATVLGAHPPAQAAAGPGLLRHQACHLPTANSLMVAPEGTWWHAPPIHAALPSS